MFFRFFLPEISKSAPRLGKLGSKSPKHNRKHLIWKSGATPLPTPALYSPPGPHFFEKNIQNDPRELPKMNHFGTQAACATWAPAQAGATIGQDRFAGSVHQKKKVFRSTQEAQFLDIVRSSLVP